jgi:hypothetical protein
VRHVPISALICAIAHLRMAWCAERPRTERRRAHNPFRTGLGASDPLGDKRITRPSRLLADCGADDLGRQFGHLPR